MSGMPAGRLSTRVDTVYSLVSTVPFKHVVPRDVGPRYSGDRRNNDELNI
jgi:hypothetical protein